MGRDPYTYKKDIQEVNIRRDSREGSLYSSCTIKSNLVHASKSLCQESQILKKNMEKIKLLAVADGVSLIRQELVWLEEQLQHEK